MSGRTTSKPSLKWFGGAGHFIGSDKCRFHLTTKVGRWLVSTVGELRWEDKAEWDTLGIDDDFYETMVFVAGKPCDVDRCGKCGLPDISGSNVDMDRYKTARAAMDGHMAMIRKWSRRKKS